MELREAETRPVERNDVTARNDVIITISNTINRIDSNQNAVNQDLTSGGVNDVSLTFSQDYKSLFKLFRNLLLLAGYIVYFVFAILHTEDAGTEQRWRLVTMTTIIALMIVRYFFNRSNSCNESMHQVSKAFGRITSGKHGVIIKWLLYVAMTAFMVVYVVVKVAMRNPENLWSLLGLFGLPVLLWLYSNNRRKVNWHTIFWGMALQFVMALIILKTSWGAYVTRWAGQRLEEYNELAHYGSEFMFGPTYTDHSFAMGATVSVLVMMVGISVVTHLGVVRFIVNTVGKPLAFCLQVAPAEGINAIANIFLYGTESALVIKEYLLDLKPSELFITYAGGMATVGGTSLVIFMSYGVSAGPLLAASAMSSPAAIVAAKLVFPSTEDEQVPGRTAETDENNRTVNDQANYSQVENQISRKTKSVADAVIAGIEAWVPLTLNGVAFIMTFVMILAFINRTLTWFGERVGVEDLTIEFIFSYIFYPMAFMMGARREHCLFIGELLGIRTFSFAIVAFPKLAPILQNGIEFRNYTGQDGNNTWKYIGDDIYLERTNKTLVGGVMDSRSEAIATYSLCGSASFAIMGFTIGTFGTLLPRRREEITRHVFRSMVAGTVASYLTACFAGILFEESLA